MDLFVLNYDKGACLYSNMRDGTFKDVAEDVGLDVRGHTGVASVAAGDVNKDGFTDFLFRTRRMGLAFSSLSDGKEISTQAPDQVDCR